MKRSIEITVSPSGEIKIDAVGFTGADCDQATRYLEEALGAVGTRVKKPEYHQLSKTQIKQKVGG